MAEVNDLPRPRAWRIPVAAIGLAVLAAGLFEGTTAAAQVSRGVDFGAGPPSTTANHFAQWVTASGDNHGLPFVVVDKAQARVLVFYPDGRLRGAAPALLGLARGDDTVPGIGQRKLASIKPRERTTPAGRFIADLGADLGVNDVLWVDYDSAISLHRVVTTQPKERRLQRLATPTAGDNRISYGCINVPAQFYDGVVQPTFTGTSGVVYILPEIRSLASVFPAFGAMAAAVLPPATSPR